MFYRVYLGGDLFDGSVVSMSNSLSLDNDTGRARLMAEREKWLKEDEAQTAISEQECTSSIVYMPRGRV